MSISDYQIEIDGLLMGPGTDYIIHSIDGFGLPTVRATDVMRPRDHGEFYGLDYLPGRTITITVTVRGDSPSDVVANVDALMSVWQPVAPDTATALPLTYEFPGQEARQFLGRPRRAAVDTSRIVGNRAEVTLEYKAADPRQYAATTSSGTLGVFQVTSGRTYPRTYPLSYGSGVSDVLIATNVGNFETRPTAHIVGPVTNPQIENVTQGKLVQFSLSLGASDFLDVDFDARTVTLNGTTSRYSSLTSDSEWWELVPGSSEIKFSSDSFDAGATLTLSWSSAWI